MEFHSRLKCEHKENRKKVCATCGKKIVFGKIKSSYFQISEKIAILIRKHINNNFNVDDDHYPTAICLTCRTSLYEREKGNFNRPMLDMPNFKTIILPKTTRNKDDICNCFICLTGRHKGHHKVVTGRGNVRNTSIDINEECGLYGACSIESLPKKEKLMPQTKQICNGCLNEIGKGIPHKCTAVTAQNNASAFIETLPHKQQEQIASKILKNKFSLATKANDATIELRSKGKPSRVIINPERPSPIFFQKISWTNFI